MASLLIVDDEESICWGLRRLGESNGHAVAVASSAERGLDLADRQRPDVVMLDVRLPGIDGLSAIDEFRKRIGSVPIIVMTAYGDLQTAVSAVRSGAFEYLVKPFDLETAERAMRRAIDSEADPTHDADRPDADGGISQVGGIIGRSPQLQSVFKQIALVAGTDVSVMLTGESGTGKELVARAIHEHGGRGTGPFVPVNIASLSETLAESELFGHVRGAFTGAESARPGLLVRASGGTLFLDEVAEIPMSTQAKLLRALEQHEVWPVGSDTPVRTDFRMISASHRDLAREVETGTFRQDLYFRLAAFQIKIPSLRERAEDIAELAEYFLSLLRGPGEPPLGLSPATLAELRRRPWHGNVRELRNVIEHATIVARSGTIEPEHLPPPATAIADDADDQDGHIERRLSDAAERWAETTLEREPDAIDLHERLLAIVEPPLFQAALRAGDGRYAAAARRLGLHRATLRKKLDP